MLLHAGAAIVYRTFIRNNGKAMQQYFLAE